jgi:hypothetical protein
MSDPDPPRRHTDLAAKLGLPDGMIQPRAQPVARSANYAPVFASESLLILSLVAIYAFFQYTISPDWPAWILAPLAVLIYRLLILRGDARGRPRYWLRSAAALFVAFAAVYTPLQWAINPDWQAWVISPLIVWSGWIVIGLFDLFAD